MLLEKLEELYRSEEPPLSSSNYPATMFKFERKELFMLEKLMWNLYLNKKVIIKRSNVTYKKITLLKKGTIIKKKLQRLGKTQKSPPNQETQKYSSNSACTAFHTTFSMRLF